MIDVELRLRSYLAARLGPLAVLLLVVVSVTAPVALFVLGHQTLELQAHESASHVAEVIRHEAEQRPGMWKYDTPKLLAHLRSYLRYENIVRIDVVDETGRLVDPHYPEASAHIATRALFWQSAPVVLGDEPVGMVWVAVDAGEVRRDALRMLVPFGALGLLLAGLMYWLPLRAMGSAERRVRGLLERLRESQAAQASLNENLEQTVEERSSELSRALRELQEKEQGLRELSVRAVSMQEAERRAIARELHDSAGQSLTAIRIHLQLIGDQIDSADPGRAASLARRTATMVDSTLEEIRRAVNTLGPAVLDDVGLGEAIGRACDDLAEQLGIVVDSRVVLDDRPLSPALESTVYRLVQEAMTNIARHAEASEVRVRVELQREREAILVTVEDDGRGFDPADVRLGRSRGLVGMRERAELLGGRLEVDSAPGKGTTLTATLPVGRD